MPQDRAEDEARPEQELSTDDATTSLDDVAAAQMAARAAAARPQWFTVGIAICMGVLVASWALSNTLAGAIISWVVVAAEIILLITWYRTMKVHIGLIQRFRPFRLALTIFFGLLAVNAILAAILLVPPWSSHTLWWLAPLCGVIGGVIVYRVAKWRTDRWVATGN